MQETYVIELIAECNVPQDVEKYSFPGIPLRKGCYPRFRVNNENYLCKIIDNEDGIAAGKTGFLTLLVSFPKAIDIRINDEFQLVTENEESIVTLAHCKATRILREESL